MYAVLHFPAFALQAVLRHEPDAETKPVVLVDPGLSTPRVIEMTASARMHGVTLGMTAPQALARCRSVAVRHRSPAQEAAATEAALQCAYGFSPGLETTGLGWITLDLRGLAELRMEDNSRLGAKTEAEVYLGWGERLRQALEALGLSAWVGLGPTPNVARHAARSGPSLATGFRRSDGSGSRVEVGSGFGNGLGASPGEGDRVGDSWVSRQGPASGGGTVWVTQPAVFVKGLPVGALEPSSDVQAVLGKWGIRTVGELLALGQAELAERLGLEALGLFAAASVTASRPLKCVRPSERFEECHEFEMEVETLEPLLFLLRRFTETIGRRLDAFGWVAGVLRLRLRLESGRLLEQELRVPEPTRRPEVLFRMLHTHLESLRTDSPVKSVELTAEPTRPEQRQLGLFESALRDPNQFQETLARLAALVGVDRVGSPVRQDSHRPDAFVLVRPDFERRTGLGREGESNPGKDRPTPLRRLRPALAAQVAWGSEEAGDRGGRPIELKCAVAGGRLVVALGPWKSSGNWWEAGGWEREEWDVALGAGRVMRLTRKDKDLDAWWVDALLD